MIRISFAPVNVKMLKKLIKKDLIDLLYITRGKRKWEEKTNNLIARLAAII